MRSSYIIDRNRLGIKKQGSNSLLEVHDCIFVTISIRLLTPFLTIVVYCEIIFVAYGDSSRFNSANKFGKDRAIVRHGRLHFV